MDQNPIPPSDIPQTQPSTPTPEMAAPAQVPQAPMSNADQQADIATTKIIAFFSYLSILFLLPMFLRPNDPLCKYHARQGMVLFFTWLGIHIIGVLGRAIHPVIGVTIYSFDGILLFIFIAIGVFNVWQGRLAPLPIIGGFADKLSAKLKTMPQQTPPSTPAQ